MTVSAVLTSLLAVVSLLLMCFGVRGRAQARTRSAAGPACARVVIAGGSFGGLTCAATVLEHTGGVDSVTVTVIDPKQFFEYNPANLRSIVEPSRHALVSMEAHELAVARDPRCRLLRGVVVSVNDSEVVLLDGSRISFDYLVLATGSGYAHDIKSDRAVTRAERLAEIAALSKRASACSLFTVVGAGLVGIELAAEIAHTFGTTKECRVITRGDAVLPTLPTAAGHHARDYLTRRGVRIEDGKGKSAQQYAASAAADEFVCDCTGIVPNPLPNVQLTEPVAVLADFVDATNCLRVTPCMQLVSRRGECVSRVFAIGDCSSAPSHSMKMAYNAELQGTVAGANIADRILHGAETQLRAFPISLSHVLPPPRLVCCSLGPRDGVLVFNDLCVSGLTAAFAKWLIERSKLGQYRGGWAATALWKIGEPATFLANRVYRAVERTMQR